MAREISISRAARLVGVKRGVLQQRIRNGELQTFEGQLRLTDLLRAYPDARFEDSSMLERVEQIIENTTFTQHNDDNRGLSKEVLAERLRASSEELALLRRRNRLYTQFVEQLRERLTRTESDPQPLASAPRELIDWCQLTIDSIENDNEHNSLFTHDIVMRVMTAQVSVIPSNHEFFVEGTESILEAGLRGGLALNYGCSNGNCGECKVRKVAGETRQIRHHDYALTDTEKQLGYLLSCAHTPLGDVTIEADEADGAHQIPHQTIDVKLRKTETLDASVNLVSLRTPRTNRLRFLAGQSVTLSFPDIGERTLPVASCPCDDMNLQFHVPVDQDPELADYLENRARSNDTIRLTGPTGSFSLREDSPNALLFIAEDVGFAPIKGLIEHAMALDTAESICLLWRSGNPDGPYMHNLCRAWHDALDNFSYRAIGGASAPESGADALRTSLADAVLSEALDVYICASPGFIEQCTPELERLGVPDSQIRVHPLGSEM